LAVSFRPNHSPCEPARTARRPKNSNGLNVLRKIPVANFEQLVSRLAPRDGRSTAKTQNPLTFARGVRQSGTVKQVSFTKRAAQNSMVLHTSARFPLEMENATQGEPAP
jgi:hypothetical protein